MAKVKANTDNEPLEKEAATVPSETQVSNDSELVTVSVSFGGSKPFVNPNDVQFKISYPDGYKGKKWFSEGEELTVSKESAAQFTEQGIGQII